MEMLGFFIYGLDLFVINEEFVFSLEELNINYLFILFLIFRGYLEMVFFCV